MNSHAGRPFDPDETATPWPDPTAVRLHLQEVRLPRSLQQVAAHFQCRAADAFVALTELECSGAVKEWPDGYVAVAA